MKCGGPQSPARLLEVAAVAALLGVAAVASAKDLTLQSLLTEPRLTAKRFANNFDTFEFEAHAEVQLPDIFLSSRRGDCDDYAILADYVLLRRGFHTRLIFIRLVGRVAHAICYVDENRAYLDYNNRVFFVNLEKCGPRLRDIADHVGEYFQANWTSVSEFTYTYEEDKKRFIMTVVKTDPPSSDADLVPRAAKRSD